MTQRVQMTFRYRFHPTAEQAEQLGRTFGCVRLVYNMALEARIRALQDGRPLTYGETSALLTVWKKKDEFSFLRDVSCVPLQQALRHLQAAVGNFLAGRARRPRFTSRRRSRASAEFTRSAFTYCDGRLTLAKMRSPLRIVWSRPLPEGAEPSTVTVSRDAAGRWFVCLLCHVTVRPLPPTRQVIGLDAGIAALVTTSTGEKVRNPRHERSHRRRLVKAQRALSRKLPGSANHAKARLRLARVHAHIADRRRDHLHKLTTRLVRENQAVVIEDLNVGGMVRNHRLARAIADAAWRETRSMLEYKCAWYGRELIVVDRWFPSSKRCSSCGAVRQDMPLDVRKWTCGCGAEHDRDVNAARNILAVGLAERRNACGADIRPQRETSFRAGDRRRSRNLPSPEEKPSLAW
ncbi:IS200/IS605 family element transposase accessory protein TnpB [Actinomadura geliboluensis]|uniref:IS200/IS605 family element transposase accessory protein TnpB n=1 Tax=Actinomadura geliboluensis TaxID=882440 RepID=A0A5S4GRA1_9ACTN|nr:RNA-guided endonuclease TnpB family protein [Actinomadura geliboluensis]TMR35061.1 IS200/IS605 family element transposase accessory protein TnpB [Actinomadura geliboluensis]